MLKISTLEESLIFPPKKSISKTKEIRVTSKGSKLDKILAEIFLWELSVKTPFILFVVRKKFALYAIVYFYGMLPASSALF